MQGKLPPLTPLANVVGSQLDGHALNFAVLAAIARNKIYVSGVVVLHCTTACTLLVGDKTHFYLYPWPWPGGEGVGGGVGILGD